METEATVHTMPLTALRARVEEALRLIGEAHQVARAAFDVGRYVAYADGAEASLRVGQLLDAAQRLLPGMPPLADERPPARAKRHDSGWRRVTLRGGEERALDALERTALLERVGGEAASLVAMIERRSSSAMRVAEDRSTEEDGVGKVDRPATTSR
jgi:hypothetical protein